MKNSPNEIMDGEDSGKAGSSISIRMLAMQEAFADPFQQGPYSMEHILSHSLRNYRGPLTGSGQVW